jgi:hypothetical protein
MRNCTVHDYVWTFTPCMTGKDASTVMSQAHTSIYEVFALERSFWP